MPHVDGSLVEEWGERVQLAIERANVVLLSAKL